METMEGYYKEYYQFLTLCSFTVTKDMYVSQDLVQDFFLYCCRREDPISFQNFKSYAAKAVKNLSLQYLNKHQLRYVTESEVTALSESQEMEVPPDYSNKVRQVERLIQALPESRREILMSSVVDGLTYTEIAEDKNISVNTVKTQIKRAYSFIRKNTENLASLLPSLF